MKKIHNHSEFSNLGVQTFPFLLELFEPAAGRLFLEQVRHTFRKYLLPIGYLHRVQIVFSGKLLQGLGSFRASKATRALNSES